MSGIMENAVGGLIASETHGILALLLSRITNEIKLNWGFTKELEDLKNQFTTLNLLLKDASFQSYNNNNGLIRDWLNKLNDVAHVADDLLDKCSYDALKHRGGARNAKDRLKDGVTSSFSRYHMARRVRKLRKLIANIYGDAKIIGLKPIKVAIGYNNYGTLRSHSDEVENTTQQNRRQWVDDRFLVGRDEDITRLVRLLCDPRNTKADLTIVGVVGLAGLGKTALSKRVAKAKEVMECFNSQVIWVVVSHTFDQINILKKMVEILFGEASNLSESQAIVNKLGEKLNEKRYLLVLDDVWDTFDWEPFRCALQEIGGSKGTTLLVTSRDKDVVEKMDSYSCDNHDERALQRAHVYHLQGLSEVDSWSLFMARTCGDNNNVMTANDEAYVIAKRMLKRCGGVPLAIRALGDLLREQNTKAWKEIEESDVWEKHDRYGILPSLKLSFIYLPNVGLKKCFSYCAIFGEDEVIEKNKLIQLWMAQGFLQPFDKMELIGENYLNILLSSSLFQEAKLDELGNVETFKIHDLVLSLARVVSRDSKVLNLEEKIKINDISSGVRRQLQSTTLFEEDIMSTFCKKFRTYYYNPESLYVRVYKSLKFLKHAINLRVLCLCNLGLKELPESIGCLKHVRYLDISGNEFEILPKVITKMYHLQTLRVLSIGKVHGTKHFPIFTKEVSSLVNLRHICASRYQEIGIPLGLSHLSSLQTIPMLDIRQDWGGTLGELGPLVNLKGTLNIQGLECIHCLDEAQSLNLGNKLNVDRLILKWSNNLDKFLYNVNEILEALQPHESLSTLEVGFYGGTRLPRWLIEMKAIGGSPLNNLVSLRLYHFTYAEGNLNLENLRSLRFLSIKQCYLLNVIFPKHGFKSCKLLESVMIDGCNIENLPNLSPLTRLRALGITSCHGRRRYKLELQGLASLPCLTKLYTDELLPRDLVKGSPLSESLRVLDLACRDYLYDDGRETLPLQLEHLEALQSLQITEFECLETLPDWLGKLTSLEWLVLDSLPKLKCLPSKDAMQSLKNLKYLKVRGCPLIKKRFSKKNGELFKVLGFLDVSWLNSERQASSSSVERSFVQGRFSKDNIRNSI